ncbi:DUF418 domain-containing protein [Salipaludibacillus aurantiacus]|uniref:DUF418 domain-containing protein n=1 Tax=Salipaludibacillus aurantiacus TaxID=1601833 RepID=A0A1H9NXX3_9BACI|nr:DUF418 domain-containing protein [Salipaludibacillus aurantiacus]SER40778.1 uncharacterized protein SAMN05518684_10155 [Salipaludibacillus aurantiacus]
MSKNVFSAPLPAKERVHELDIIRGFALLGILFANMPYFASPEVYLTMTNVVWWTESWNVFAEFIIHFFASSKFFTMFSFLFGLGFIIFLQRAEQKAAKPQGLFIRRLVILLVIGIIHAFGIWYGDILVIYALTGFFLLLFYKSTPKTVLVWAFLLILIPVSFISLMAILIFMAGDLIPSDAESMAIGMQMLEQSITAYGSGNTADIFSQRAADYSFMFSNYVFMMPVILGMFLFGVYIAKTEKYKDIPSHIPFFKRVWKWSLAVGLPFNVMFVYSYFEQGAEVSVHMMTYFIGSAIGGPALCFFYMTSIILLMRKEKWIKLFNPLRAVGRTALSNYLLQSIIATSLFYNYGLGLYGEVGPLIWLVMAAVLFAGQIWVSNKWIKKYRFGPAEWIWRSLTYGKRQPFKM